MQWYQHIFFLFYCYNTSLLTWGVFYLLKTQKLKHVYPTTSQDGDKYSSTFPMLIVIEHKFTLLQNFCEHTVFLWPQKNYSTCHSWKKSFPLSSTTMNAGKFLTSTFQIASMPEKKSFDSVTKTKWHFNIKMSKYILTGCSKRGWFVKSQTTQNHT